ncbi:MAG: 16S rRNA (cytosine(967)-C(5))-methyltransferase [Clostridiales bacterium]|nr:16S rRNA (cytosine(967)-C(5))-methyltransferase [Clostridiales bacterium]
MAENVNLRSLVTDILLTVDREGELSHLAIRGVLDKYRYLPRQDRAFIKRVSEGTMERMLEIDYIIDQFSRTKVKKMKPVIRAILRSAVYQLKYMDAVPDSAACNEAVKLAVKRGFSGLRGFVNGVLRSIARNKESIVYPSMETEPVWAISIRYSMPEWIVNRFCDAYGQERCIRILAAYLGEDVREPSQMENEQKESIDCSDADMRSADSSEVMLPLREGGRKSRVREKNPGSRRGTCVRVDTNRKSAEEVCRSLEAQGINVMPHGRLSYAFYISGYDVLDEIPEFSEGILYVQDVSSMMVAEIAQPGEDDFILDVCAAPGGKSLHLAQMMHGTGMVEARDLTEYKADLIRENISRCRAENMRAVVWDATVFDPEMEEKADIVIADLPCSGLGVIGRKTDIKYRASEEGILELSELQKKILEVVWRYVKPGGTLMYSTCTMTAEENEENTAWFLRQHPQFSLVSERQYLPDEGCDGFYIAKISRR